VKTADVLYTGIGVWLLATAGSNNTTTATPAATTM
jgi:hypothetical protein